MDGKAMDTESIDKVIRKNSDYAHFLLNKAKRARTESIKVRFLEKTAKFMADNCCGFLSSTDLEKQVISIANKYHEPINNDYKEMSILHVISITCLVGGHTRVLERWIENSPREQLHSVAITMQKNERNIPDKLINEVYKKKGTIYPIYKESDSMKRALNLRQIASQYKCVILHIHPYDIIPILAFGTTDFLRPVIFFNHADHLFWVGRSISDLVVNFRTFSNEMNKMRRGIENNFVLPLPVEHVDSIANNKEETRSELGLPNNSRVIVSMASEYKYYPIDSFKFTEVVKKILDNVDDVTFIIIGPSEESLYWKELKAKYNSRIKMLGTIPFSQISRYVEIADIALDSFPFNSFTALLDIARYKIPCLTLLTPIGSLDTFHESGIVCKSQDEIVERCIRILNTQNDDFRKLYDIIQQKHLSMGFSVELNRLYDSIPKKHELHTSDLDNSVITDMEYFVFKMFLSSNDVKHAIYLQLLEKWLNERNTNSRKKLGRKLMRESKSLYFDLFNREWLMYHALSKVPFLYRIQILTSIFMIGMYRKIKKSIAK